MCIIDTYVCVPLHLREEEAYEHEFQCSDTIMLFVERMALPRIDQPPVWILAKDRLLPGDELRGRRLLLLRMDRTPLSC